VRRALIFFVAAVAACVPAAIDADRDRADRADLENAETRADAGRASGSEAGRAEGGSDDPSGCDVSGDPFDADALHAEVGFLASEKLDGRVPGSAGDRSARDFIEARFRCLGLVPGGEAGSYQQPFVNGEGVTTANVVGFIPGTDPGVASDIIVVGAHHDHFGTVGGEGLRLGANDNASGVVGMLAVAQAIRQRKVAPRRTVAFVAFGSEETLAVAPFTEGSAAYVANAPTDLPLSRVVYMINFDMIGSYSQEKKVYAIGTVGTTPARGVLEGLAGATPALSVSLGEPGEEGASDHYPFCVAGIPYVFFWTSDDACYHKSCDRPEALDYVHLAEIARRGADLTGSLGDSTVDLAAWRRTAKVSQLGCKE